MNVKNVYQKESNLGFVIGFIIFWMKIHCNFLWKNKNFKNVRELKGYFSMYVPMNDNNRYIEIDVTKDFVSRFLFRLLA